MLALFFVFPRLRVVIDPETDIFENDGRVDADLRCYMHVEIVFHTLAVPFPY